MRDTILPCQWSSWSCSVRSCVSFSIMAGEKLKKLRLFFSRAERTELAPELLEQMTNIDETNNYVRLLIERIRRVAQPNKSHRTADSRRLVPPDPAADERLQLMGALHDGIKGCMSDNPAVVGYLKAVAEAEDEVHKSHERYLRQAQIYTVNELRKFSDGTYVEIRQAYDELNKRRTAYDYARERLRRCAGQDVERCGQEAQVQQRSFEQQAAVLHGLVTRLPEYQSKIAKAVCVFMRAESEYGRTSHNSLKTIGDPEAYMPVAVEANVQESPTIVIPSRVVAISKPSPSVASPSPSGGNPMTRPQQSVKPTLK